MIPMSAFHDGRNKTPQINNFASVSGHLKPRSSNVAKFTKPVIILRITPKRAKIAKNWKRLARFYYLRQISIVMLFFNKNQLNHGPLLTRQSKLLTVFSHNWGQARLSWIERNVIKILFYFVTGCNCSKLGSESNACDIRTGQCRCRPHVTGRACDTCEVSYL